MGGTKINSNVCVRRLRVRGGNFKYRALRLDAGNFSWPTEAVTRKTRVLDVTYNASNNELVRTQTLVKSAVVQVDATPFRHWYESHYGVKIGVMKAKGKGTEQVADDVKRSAFQQAKIDARQKGRKLDTSLDEQFAVGPCTLASRRGRDSAGAATDTSWRVR